MLGLWNVHVARGLLEARGLVQHVGGMLQILVLYALLLRDVGLRLCLGRQCRVGSQVRCLFLLLLLHFKHRSDRPDLLLHLLLHFFP